MKKCIEWNGALGPYLGPGLHDQKILQIWADWAVCNSLNHQKDPIPHFLKPNSSHKGNLYPNPISQIIFPLWMHAGRWTGTSPCGPRVSQTGILPNFIIPKELNCSSYVWYLSNCFQEVPELDEPQMSITIRFKPQSENLSWPQPILSPNYCHSCQEYDGQHLHRQVRLSNFNIYRCNCSKNAYVNVAFISTILWPPEVVLPTMTTLLLWPRQRRQQPFLVVWLLTAALDLVILSPPWAPIFGLMCPNLHQEPPRQTRRAITLIF